MAPLVTLGKITDLEELCAELKRRITARAFAEPRLFEKAAEQILVDHPLAKALVLPAGTVIDGDLDIDDEALGASGIATIAVLGDLTVNGRILNADSGGGHFLFVDGNVSARQVLKGGSSFTVLGSLESADVIFCDYNHGELIVAGDITAPSIIINDQEIEAGGAINGQIISDEIGNMRALLVPEVFADPDDAEDEWPDGDLVRERLEAGLAILR